MRSISASAISGFVRAVRYSAGTPARSNRLRSLIQLSGRKSRNATMTGTSPLASVSDTRVWQFAVLPSAEAYCAATPTECVPSSALRYHQSPAPHRCHRRAGWLERATPSPTAKHPKRQPQQNDATDHNHPAQAAPPSAERSCDRQARSAPPRKADTYVDAPYGPGDPRTASASLPARLPNPKSRSPWSALQKPTPYESFKNRFGNPDRLTERTNLPK